MTTFNIKYLSVNVNVESIEADTLENALKFFNANHLNNKDNICHILDVKNHKFASQIIDDYTKAHTPEVVPTSTVTSVEKKSRPVDNSSKSKLKQNVVTEPPVIKKLEDEKRVIGNTTFDLTYMTISVGTAIETLSNHEYKLFEALSRDTGIAANVTALLQVLYGDETNLLPSDTKTVSTVFSRLRRKLRNIGSDVQVVNRRHLGYTLQIEPSE